MKKTIILLLSLFMAGAASVQSQVTVGSQNDPHAGAVLDLQSTSKGLLLPNVSLSDVNILTVISSPTAAEKTSARGMVVYNTNASTTGGNGVGIYVWDGAKWQLSGGSQSTGLPGTPDTWVTVDPANPGDGTAGNPYKNVCPGTTVTLTPRSGYSFGTVTPSSAATVSGNSLVFNATGSVVVTKDGQSGTVYVAISSCGAPVIETGRVAGMIFMDRNLGADATVIAVNANDPRLYGDLYQWGRKADGHERRISESVAGPYAGTVDPTTGQIPSSESSYYGKFITREYKTTSFPLDWRTVQNDNLWRDDDYRMVNPCPNGYRIPTIAEWTRVFSTAGTIPVWTSSIKNLATPSANFYLPAAGYRKYDGTFITGPTELYGNYWSSTAGTGANQGYSHHLSFYYGGLGTVGVWTHEVAYRSQGESVRCVKIEP